MNPTFDTRKLLNQISDLIQNSKLNIKLDRDLILKSQIQIYTQIPTGRPYWYDHKKGPGSHLSDSNESIIFNLWPFFLTCEFNNLIRFKSQTLIHPSFLIMKKFSKSLLGPWAPSGPSEYAIYRVFSKIWGRLYGLASLSFRRKSLRRRK